MKILHVNTYDRGGAANACIRLHLSLLDMGIDSHLLILQKFEKRNIPHCHVFENTPKKTYSKIYRILFKLFPPLENILNRNEKTKRSIRNLIPETLEWFSFPDTNIDITTHPLYKEADVINLHWVSDFIDYSFFIKNKKPVVWTLHDMNPFTGGCHYSFSCKGFENNCLDCPQLQSIQEHNFSSIILKYKEKHLLQENKITLVSPSVWLKDQLKSSKILKNKKDHVVPYGINGDVFKCHDKSYSRQILGLPMDKKIILFVSPYLLNNTRKGYSYLMDSLIYLSDFKHDTVLCVIGGNKNLRNDAFKVYEYSKVDDEEKMSLFYSACDLYVTPSLEDNLPNTVLESLICGTPVVAFNIGGMPDMIINGENGYLAKELSPVALAASIRKMLKDPEIFNNNRIRENAMKKYDSSIQAQNYVSLYKNIIA